MNPPNVRTSGSSSWFWGIALSLSLHGIILLLALFWGFGAPEYSGEPQSIEGRLVSLSELERPGGREVEPTQVEKKEPPQEPNEEKSEKAEVKKEEIPPKVKEKEPEKREIQASKPEKEPPKETKKEEPKKAEAKKETPKIDKEEPAKKDTVVLDSKEKEKKEEKKQVAKKPEPTEPPKATPPKEPEEKKGPNFEDVRRGVLEDMQKSVVDKKRRSVIEDIEKGVEEEEVVAEANSSGEETQGSRQTEQPGGGAASGVVTSLFIQRIREEIRSSWKIPPTIPTDESLETVVVFRVDESGKVYDVRVEESSGNPAFDDFCVKAIYKAAPLTPPPPELLEEAKTEGVEVTFYP